MIPYKLNGDLVKSKKNPDSGENTIPLDYVEGNHHNTCEYFQQSFWELSDDEIQDIVKNKTIVLNLYGFQYPPISIHTVRDEEYENIKTSLESQLEIMIDKENEFNNVRNN